LGLIDLTALDKNGADGYETVLLVVTAQPAKKGFPPWGGGQNRQNYQTAKLPKKLEWYNRVI
jgi:hypothetical protein